MPLLLGMPGPIDRTKLLAMATKIGVGESTRFLAKHKSTFARLAAPGGFTGQRFLEECAGVAAKPESLIEGLHVFTFNQIAETEAWRQELLGAALAERHPLGRRSRLGRQSRATQCRMSASPTRDRAQTVARLRPLRTWPHDVSAIEP